MPLALSGPIRIIAAKPEKNKKRILYSHLDGVEKKRDRRRKGGAGQTRKKREWEQVWAGGKVQRGQLALYWVKGKEREWQ
jgi:hypothetical protein